jgi:hypothetical protein
LSGQYVDHTAQYCWHSRPFYIMVKDVGMDMYMEGDVTPEQLIDLAIEVQSTCAVPLLVHSRRAKNGKFII